MRRRALDARRWTAPIAVAAALVAGRADAFTLNSAVTDPCHESVTIAVLLGARRTMPLAPIATDRNESALVDDVPFILDPDVAELAGATMVLAVRDNDIKGNDPNDL